MNSAMHSSIHKVFEAVQDLEPLSPSATPGTIRAFTETTDEFYKYTGLMHFHLSAIREASGIDSHCDWDEPEAPYIKAPVSPEARYEEVVESLDGDTFSADELVQFLLTPPPKTQYDAEQQGFLRLVRGYSQAASVDEMASFLNAGHQEDDFSHLTERSINLESTLDITARLHQRESILFAVHTANSLSAFVHAMLVSIHAINFSYEWNELSFQPGGKLWKTQYRINAFETFNPDFQSYSRAEYKKKLKAFTSRHEKVIKARNNVRSLFVMFHSAVLLDPTWMPTASYTTGTTGRSPSFPATLDCFLTNSDTSNEMLRENEAVFKQLVEALVPESTRNYIFQFLAKYPF